MPRSLWKGPYVHPGLYRRIKKLIDVGIETQKGPILVHSRQTVIMPEFMGIRFEVHNGHKFEPLEVKDMHIGHKFGEFSFTRHAPQSVFENDLKKTLAAAAAKAAKKK